MHWFAFAIVTPILVSAGNFIDKILTERFISKEASIWVLMFYSSLFSLIVFPIIWAFNPSVINAPIVPVLLLMLAGVIELVSVFLYLNALRDEDASTVVPFFQSIPVFSLILGYLILGETIGMDQAIAGLIIILGGVLLTLEFSEDRRRVRMRIPTLMLMLGSSFSFALYDALFKFNALQESFWTSLFWQHVGMALAGIALYCVMRQYRKDFKQNLKENGGKVFGLNVLNEVLYAVGMAFYAYALLLAPIAIVATATVYQPVFVFIGGLFFTLFLPHILTEKFTARHIAQKVCSIAVIVVASLYLMGTTGG